MFEALKWDAAGLVTVVVQDRLTGELRMLAHANAEAIAATLETGQAHFFSRSRQSLWRKGESSGNVLQVHEVWVDCDGDALVYLVTPAGPSCHTGRDNCFFRRLDEAAAPLKGLDGLADGPGPRPTLMALGETLAARAKASSEQSYTRRLLDKGASKIGEKLREEAGELSEALADESDERVASEAADVLYHLMVGLELRGLSLKDVQRQLQRRFGTSGLEEKASRTKQ